MCSSPSMPPRSTNAPKSAMFLTVPVTMSPSWMVSRSFLPLLGASVLDELSAGDDDVAPLGVDLEDLGLDGLADVDADVGRPADVDLARGEEDRHADVDEQPALDLPHDLAFDLVLLALFGGDLLPAADAVGFPLGDGHRAAVAFDVLEQDFDGVADLDLGGVVELVLVEDALGLEADLDEEVVAGVADDAPLEDAAGLEVADLIPDQMIEVAPGGARAECVGDHGVSFLVLHRQRCDQVPVNQKINPLVYGFTRPGPRRADTGRERRLPPWEAASTWFIAHRRADHHDRLFGDVEPSIVTTPTPRSGRAAHHASRSRLVHPCENRDHPHRAGVDRTAGSLLRFV